MNDFWDWNSISIQYPVNVSMSMKQEELEINRSLSLNKKNFQWLWKIDHKHLVAKYDSIEQRPTSSFYYLFSVWLKLIDWAIGLRILNFNGKINLEITQTN